MERESFWATSRPESRAGTASSRGLCLRHLGELLAAAPSSQGQSAFPGTSRQSTCQMAVLSARSSSAPVYPAAHRTLARGKELRQTSRTGDRCQDKTTFFIKASRGPHCGAAFKVLHTERLIQQVLLPRHISLSEGSVGNCGRCKTEKAPLCLELRESRAQQPCVCGQYTRRKAAE